MKGVHKEKGKSAANAATANTGLGIGEMRTIFDTVPLAGNMNSYGIDL